MISIVLSHITIDCNNVTSDNVDLFFYVKSFIKLDQQLYITDFNVFQFCSTAIQN